MAWSAIKKDDESLLRGSWWSITINNPTDEDRQLLAAPPAYVRELIGQDEIGQTGTLHIQACANTTQQRLSALKEWLPRAHLQKAYKGKEGAALKNYCQKSETAVPGTQFHFIARQTRQSDNEIVDGEDLPPPAPVLSLKEVMLIIASNCPLDEDDTEIHSESDLVLKYRLSVERIAEVSPDLLEKVTRQNVFQTWKLTGHVFLAYVRIIQSKEWCDDDIILFDECMLCECGKDECLVCA